MDGGRKGPLVGVHAPGHGLVLGPAEGAFDVVQMRAVGGQVAELDALCLQLRLGLPDQPGRVDGGIVQDHHARQAVALGQGVEQEVEQVLALPVVGCRPPGQGRRGRGTGGGLDRHYVHALALGAFVGHLGPVAAAAPAVGGGLGQGEAAFVEEEEPQAVGPGFFLRSSSSSRASAAASRSCRWRRTYLVRT